MTLPIVAYGFVGVEIIAVTAFEARNPQALRFPAKWIAYIIFLLNFLIVLGEILTVDWKDSSLRPLNQRSSDDAAAHNTSIAIFVLAPLEAGIRVLPGLLSGFMFFFGISCANTALYVASRTLFGLTREIPSNHELLVMRLLSKMGTTTPRTLVPGWALLFSTLAFFWLPFLHLKRGYSTEYVKQLSGPAYSFTSAD